jgi:uncharacterized phiE125 gp8 family phage protein
MNLVELTEVPDAALPVARLKEHLRLGTGFADDDVQDVLLAGFLRAAIAAVEGRTGKVLLTRTFDMMVGAWRRPDRQPIPVAPVSDVSAVILADATGAVTPVPVGAWRLEADAARPCLVASAILPPVPAGGSAHVTFEAGYGPDWKDVPADLGQAVLMLAAHYHEFRHETALGPGCMPFGVTALIERYRPIRLSGGL